MKKHKKKLLMLTEDYKTLISCLNGENGKMAFDQRNAEDLRTELKKAKLVTKDNFPPDIVRINSTVRIKAEKNSAIMEFKLVTPDKANIREKRISVLAPLGTALLGFRQGEEVQWQMPAGRETFTIVEVRN